MKIILKIFKDKCYHCMCKLELQINQSIKVKYNLL